MKLLFEIFEMLVLVYFVLVTCYYLTLSFACILGKKNGKRNYRESLKFAVVIPAHNEETTIEKTLESINTVKYPKELFDCIVVSDNSDDRTAEIARNKGAVVYDRVDRNNLGKGYALEWIFAGLVRDKKDYDAFVIVDADSLISPNFLKVMNDMLWDGHLVIQGYSTVTNVGESWRTALMFASFALLGYLRPLGKNVLGLSAAIRGTGMCFSRRVLEEVKWDCYSIVEDGEYNIKLLLSGIKVKFAPEAIVYSAMPVSSRQARTQRIRWEGGAFGVVKKYFCPMLTCGIKRNDFTMFLEAFERIIPPFSVVFGMSSLFLGISILGKSHFAFPQGNLHLIIWSVVVAGQIIYFFTGLFLVKAPATVYYSLVRIPIYLIWKIWIYFLIIVGVNKGRWVRTSRENV